MQTNVKNHDTWLTVEVQERKLLSVRVHGTKQDAIAYANRLLRKQVSNQEEFDAAIARGELSSSAWELANGENFCAWCNECDGWDCFWDCYVWKL